MLETFGRSAGCGPTLICLSMSDKLDIDASNLLVEVLQDMCLPPALPFNTALFRAGYRHEYCRDRRWAAAQSKPHMNPNRARRALEQGLTRALPLAVAVMKFF